MAKWLDKYEQGGMVLKKKTKDNYGKKPNVNDVKVSAGPGFEGDGYTAYNWKSPAWGGSFAAMGTSIPGSTGMMYARTINPAPANGKYTKKTLASAQVGIEMPKAELTPDIRKSKLSTAIKSGTQDSTATNLETDSFGQAYKKARKQGKTKFSYQGKDYSTKYKGTPEEQLRQTGITDAQLHDRNIIQDQLAKNLSGVGYEYSEAIGAMFGKNKFRKKLEDAAATNKDMVDSGWSSEMSKRRLDAQNLYNGLPQKYNTFSVSKNKPSVSSDKNAIYYSVTNDKLRDQLRKMISMGKYSPDAEFNDDYRGGPLGEYSLVKVPGKNAAVTYDASGIMGDYTTSLGRDDKGEYVSYYDKWDIAPMNFGKPMEIYDKIYLSDLFPEQNKPKMQNGGEMEYYQNGLDFKPKSISKKGKKIIKDDMGQWAHPGEITEIGSPDITMQGVDYPVLGISDTGDTQMMYPNQDYKFDGKKVTEYPMAQNGELLKKFSTIINDQVPSTSSVQRKIADDIAAKQYIALQKQIDKQGSITKAGPRQSALSKTWSVLTNPMTALEYKVHGKDLPDHFEMGPRNVLDYAVDFINPYGVADAASNVPGDLARGDLGSAALNTLAALPALHETGAIAKATKTARQLGKAKNLKEAAGYLAKGIPVEKSLPRLAEGEVKTFRKLQEIPKMQEAGKSRADQMRFAIENDIPDTHFERIFQMPKKDAQNLINSGFGERPAVDREALRNRFRELDQQVNVPQNPSINTREAWISDIDDLTAQGAEPNHDFYEQLGHRTTPTSYEQMTDSEIESLRNHLFDRQMSARRERIANENSMLGVDYDVDRDLYDLSDLDLDTNDFINHYQSQQTPQNNKGVQNIGDKLTRAEISARDKVNTFIQNATQSYPYYSGGVEEKVPSLFRSQERSLNDISRKVAKQTENIPSGTVYTGSLNTSHNSWLPQTKQIFNYEGGTPQFTGYKPMNSLGYLSRAQVPEEDIIKYLNTEMDELVKRGKLPENVQRPMMFKGHPMLPQYAIKQKKSGGWLNKYK